MKTLYIYSNFKYRERFNKDKTASENDIAISTKFFQYFNDEIDLPKTINKQSNVYKNLQNIRNALASEEIYNIVFYYVTNEANGFASQAKEQLQTYEELYGMTINSITLDDIISYLYQPKKNFVSKILLSDNDFIAYNGDVKSTDSSYICKVSLLELIRITCTDVNIREQHYIEDDLKIQNCKLDYSLLYDNVRGYLGQTDYNKNIYKTIKESSESFFLYNNGITITCSNVTSEAKNSNQKYLLTLEDLQVVNGGQTLRSIYNYLTKENSTDALKTLRKSTVLIRIFKIDSENNLRNNIAEYTNSQNATSPIDLKSVNKIQIDIERYLKSENILYIRKAGDVGDTNVAYDYRISMEKFTQILFASQGFPEKSSNAKKRLFTSYYDDIYSDENFKIEDSKKLIETYFHIEKFYKEQTIQKYDQKIFYILYIMYKNVGITVEEASKKLENALKNHPSTQTAPRILLRTDFKTLL